MVLKKHKNKTVRGDNSPGLDCEVKEVDDDVVSDLPLTVP